MCHPLVVFVAFCDGSCIMFTEYVRMRDMRKKRSIPVIENVYGRLPTAAECRHNSQITEALVSPDFVQADIEAGYRQMAQDEQREADALAWIESVG